MNKSIIKTGILCLSFLLWSLMLIYGTYNNTVRNAHVVGATGSYQIQYDNTGDIMDYEVK